MKKFSVRTAEAVVWRRTIDQKVLDVPAVEVVYVAEDILRHIQVLDGLTEPAEKAVRVNLSGCGIQYVLRGPVHLSDYR